LRVVITAVLGNVTIQKYIEGGTTGTSIAGGNADVNDTFAMQMLKDKIAQVGFSAIYDNSFAPNAFHGFMTNLFSTASPDDSGVAGSMAGGREIIKCLMAGGHSPFEFGFASWPNGISRITSGVLTSSEIEALVIAGDVYCSLNESSLRTRLEGMRDSMPSIGNFANQHIAGNKTTSDNILANSDEMSSYTNVVHGMNINKIKNGFGSLGGAIVRSVERARSQGNYSSMTDRNRAHVFAQAIEDDNFDPDDQEGAAVMMQMIEGLDLSGEISSTALEQYGAIIGGAVGGANTSTFQQMQSNPGLYSNYFVNQYDSNQIDDPNDITDNIDGIAGNVESNRISIEECLQQPGSSNTSCFENHSLDDWGY
jgi:hypothetical protein